MKSILRGIFYFVRGIKFAFLDFVEWFTTSDSVPRFMRNKASLAVLTLAVVVGGWGAFSALGGLADRSVTVEPSSSETVEAAPVSQVEAAPEPSSSEQAASVPSVDTLASATKFKPVEAEQLKLLIKKKATEYKEKPEFSAPPPGDIGEWKKVNPDVVGWITIPNTNINYPLLIGPYTNYYNNRDVYKQTSRNGVIWFDTDTKFDSKGDIASRNAVIYGHNWTNCWRPVRIGNPADVMLAQLAAYDDAEFMKANPYIRITTGTGDHIYQIFSVFYTTTAFGYNYADGAVVDQIVKVAKSKDIHKLNVPVSTTDKIITLSTCTRIIGPGDDQRFVVMAKRIS